MTHLPEELRHCTRLRRLDLSYNKYKELPVHKLPEEKKAEKLAAERERLQFAAAAATNSSVGTTVIGSSTSISGVGTPGHGSGNNSSDKHSPALSPRRPTHTTIASPTLLSEVSQTHTSTVTNGGSNGMYRSTATGSMSSLTSVSSVGTGGTGVSATSPITLPVESEREMRERRERQLDEIERKEREFLKTGALPSSSHQHHSSPLKPTENEDRAWVESRPEVKGKNGRADDRFLDLPWRDPREERERAEESAGGHHRSLSRPMLASPTAGTKHLDPGRLSYIGITSLNLSNNQLKHLSPSIGLLRYITLLYYQTTNHTIIICIVISILILYAVVCV